MTRQGVALFFGGAPQQVTLPVLNDPALHRRGVVAGGVAQHQIDYKEELPEK